MLNIHEKTHPLDPIPQGGGGLVCCFSLKNTATPQYTVATGTLFLGALNNKRVIDAYIHTLHTSIYPHPIPTNTNGNIHILHTYIHTSTIIYQQHQQTESGVMALDFHPQLPHLLAVGCHDGRVLVFDLTQQSLQG